MLYGMSAWVCKFRIMSQSLRKVTDDGPAFPVAGTGLELCPCPFTDGRRTAVSICGHTFWLFPSRFLLAPYIEIPIHTVRKKKYGQLQDIKWQFPSLSYLHRHTLTKILPGRCLVCLFLHKLRIHSEQDLFSHENHFR